MLACGVLTAGCARPSSARSVPPPVLLATTTSFQDSGLLDALLERWKASGGAPIKPLAVGTGEALALGERGEVDVLVVHAPSAEEEFVRRGRSRCRRALWHNDFVIVGPAADPAAAAGRGSTPEVLKAIAAAGAPFVSRGDRSGTHLKEQRLFADAELAPWPTYRSAGSGMADTLRIASEKGAYALSDRGTWAKLRGSLALVLIHQGDPPLENPYHVIEVKGAANAAGARAFAEFLVSTPTQQFVGQFGVETVGEVLFQPDAKAGDDCAR